MWASCFLEHPMDSPTGFQSPLSRATPHLHNRVRLYTQQEYAEARYVTSIAYGFTVKKNDAKTNLNVKLAFIPRLKPVGIPARLC
jgi:hypothetical protein